MNTSNNPITTDDEVTNQNSISETRRLSQNYPIEYQRHEKPPNPDLTFITGSCILKTIETRFLGDKVRVKSFNKAKIETLQENLSRMDLSRYKHIILHIGGHDIDAQITPDDFKKRYQSLLQSLSGVNCNIFVSGLLPRGKTDMKPFNNIMKDLCSQFKAKFINNHDSFIMASGELPYEYFQEDQINLKFSGTRLLVRNMNNSCPILPSRSSTNKTDHRTRGFYNQNRRTSRQPYTPRHYSVLPH